MSLLHPISFCLLSFFLIVSFCQSAYSHSIEDALLSSNFNAFKSAPPANSFELDGIRNLVVNPSTMKGQVVILNFWKIDCAACSMEKPILEKLFRKYSDQGLVIVAVNLFDRPSDILEYINKTDYPFIYAFDSHQRYTVNQKRLPSGIPTTFVVNSDSEAIYEIPGLPTTYVIDRTGRVVGYSIGLVNWDDATLNSYIESLLSPKLTTVASVETGSFSTHARQGSGAVSGPTRSGARKYDSSESQSITAPSPFLGVPPAPSLPFQSTIVPKGDNAPPETGSGDRLDSTAQERITVKPPTQKPARDKNKPKGKQEKSGGAKALTDYSKPRPYVPSTQRGSGSTESSTYSGSPATVKPPIPNPSPVETVANDKRLPPLPAAMPYSPPSRSSQPQPTVIRPDNTGSVVARIPGASGTPTVGISSDNLPAAQPVQSRNSIGVSIIDSFGNFPTEVSSKLGADLPKSEVAPPATIFGQFTQDIQNLGAGIRDTFSSLIPRGQ